MTVSGLKLLLLYVTVQRPAGWVWRQGSSYSCSQQGGKETYSDLEAVHTLSTHGLTMLQRGLGNTVLSWGAVPRYNLELALLNMGRMNIGGQVTSDIVPKLNFPSELSLLSPLVSSSFPFLPYFFLSLPLYLPSFLPLTLFSSSSSLLSPSFLLYFPSSLPNKH